jgi:hypothetical protein
MSSFTEKLVVSKSGNTWTIEEPFFYKIGNENSQESVVVPKGFETDFASVPRVFWTIIPPDGKYTKAAVVHDYLYNKRGKLESTKYSRKQKPFALSDGFLGEKNENISNILYDMFLVNRMRND